MCIFTKVFKVDKKHLQYSSTRAKIGSMKQAFKTAGVKKLPPSGFSRLSVLYYTPLQQGKECFPKETLFVLFCFVILSPSPAYLLLGSLWERRTSCGVALVFAGALGRGHRGGAGPGAGPGPAGAAMEAAVGKTVPSTGLAGRGATAHLSFLSAFLCRGFMV